MNGQVRGESLLLAGEEWRSLWGESLSPGTLTVRSRFGINDENCVVYERGRDYEADPAGGRIRRLPGSRIPDYREHPHYGADPFNHADVYRFDNLDFFVYADYRAGLLSDPFAGQRVIRRLPGTLAAPGGGKPLRILVYGDSIATGCDASSPDRQYFNLLARWLERRTGAPVTVHNVSLGGETSRGGLERYARIAFEPPYDLCLLAYGMNDASCPGGQRLDNHVPPEEYKENLRILSRRVRDMGASGILLSTLTPNPRWMHVASRAVFDLPVYCRTLEALAEEEGLSYTDIYGVWQRLLSRKGCEDLLANNVNHPGDFGHEIYCECVKRVFAEP